jgi:SAM-dependent methyltransferase
MNDLDCQKEYWDSVASEKTFTHPIQFDKFRELVPIKSKILDYGCGYGRTCAYLEKNGYTDVVGVDISPGMISRGNKMYNGLNLQYISNSRLPFADNKFSACTLLAVLTCVPTNEGQKAIVSEIHRVLRPGGILYLSDYPLQKNQKNQERYLKFEHEFKNFGVFRLSDGGVVRHHKMPWIYEVLSGFDISYEETTEVLTMNGSKAKIFQIIAYKIPTGQPDS